MKKQGGRMAELKRMLEREKYEHGRFQYACGARDRQIARLNAEIGGLHEICAIYNAYLGYFIGDAAEVEKKKLGEFLKASEGMRLEISDEGECYRIRRVLAEMG